MRIPSVSTPRFNLSPEWGNFGHPENEWEGEGERANMPILDPDYVGDFITYTSIYMHTHISSR